MLYDLLYPLKDFWFGFNIFRYITFRASMAAITAFLICVIIGPFIIELLKGQNIGQKVRKKHVDSLKDFHSSKEDTPTMGGILIVISVLISSILWCRINNDYVILAIGSMMWMGLVGFIDDSIKVKTKSAQGAKGITKLFGQTILALIIGVFILHREAIGTEIYAPFIKAPIITLGVFYVVFAWFVVVGSTNAVNLTDGLDGLAIGCSAFVTITLAVMAYVTGNAIMAEYLNVFYLPGSGELACFSAALFGAALGFLWFNCYPANVFMGDTGALSVGGAIAAISVILKKELLLIIIGGIFVIESLSVILQVGSYKLRKKRIFLMSPIHHHFQIKGWPESKITIRFWIISIILAIIGLASLKVR